jgi:hypothetical protein
MPGLLPEGIDGSDGLCAQMRFKLCESHFDRIEIGAVGGRNKIQAPLALMAFSAALLLWAAKLSTMMTSSAWLGVFSILWLNCCVEKPMELTALKAIVWRIG